MTDNRDKKPKIDEEVLDATPPNINEPQNDDDSPEPDENEPDDKDLEKKEEEVEEKEDELDEKEEVKPPKKEEKQETEEDKEKQYKAQQTETQIQAAKSKNFVDKVEEAAKLPDPTDEELKTYLLQDGIDLDDLSDIEKLSAKRTLKAERKFDLINEAVKSSKDIDEWAKKIDTFIDSTDGEVKYLKLSGNEADFRRFAMKESHRGVDIEGLLLPAFLQQMPAKEKKRGNLFETSKGGDKQEDVSKITDADEVQRIREKNPREYRRLVKEGRIKLEV